MTVLVVEDSVEVRGRLLDLLASLPEIEVVGVAATNTEAADLFETFAPEVVTLDVSLRDGSSLRTLRRLMAAARPPVVIVLTDHAHPHYRERYLEAGARHFLVKSDMAQLQDLLRDLLDKK
ncbi:MAG: response regulator [Longimicrobiales bacterium]